MLCDSGCCTACAACVSACPKNCIRLSPDPLGRTQPAVDETECVHCGRCESVCPVLCPPKQEAPVYPEVYCAKSKDDGVVRRSASGGVATEITKYFVEKGGYACGVQNGADFVPRFILLDKRSDCGQISGSRYVHSRADGIYPKVKEVLEKGEDVFFCGLPCQVAALYAFLGKPYDTLFTADIVCHGCAEEDVYRDYLEYVQKERGDAIVRIEHTSKDRGWSVLIQKLMKIEFKSGEILYRWSQQDPYLSLFLDGSIFKPCCYDCRFSRFPRTGDLTLGDFFGIGTMRKIKGLDRGGVSMAMINTKKGHDLFHALSSRLQAEKRDIREAVYFNHNLWKPTGKSAIRKDLEQELCRPDWARIARTYYGCASGKMQRKIRKIIKSTIGDRNTARLMLMTYKMNGTTEKADRILEELRNEIGRRAESENTP